MIDASEDIPQRHETEPGDGAAHGRVIVGRDLGAEAEWYEERDERVEDAALEDQEDCVEGQVGVPCF